MECKYTVWRLTAHHDEDLQDEATSWCRDNERIAIGWGQVGSLNGWRLYSYAQMCDLLTDFREQFPDRSGQLSGARCLHNFFHILQRHDLVIVGHRDREQLVVQVDGPYRYEPTGMGYPGCEYQHQRAVTVLEDEDAKELWKRGGGVNVPPGQNGRFTLFRLRNRVALRNARLAA